MANWQNLQTLLEGIATNVYFQPPEKTKLKYPCIVFKLNAINTKFADNSPYKVYKRYTLTIMDEDPEGELLGKVIMLPMCAHDRRFVVDNLYHDVFSLYY